MTGTQEKVLGAIAGISIGLQIIVRSAHNSGRLSDGPLYWPSLIALSAITFGAVLWIFLGRRSR